MSGANIVVHSAIIGGSMGFKLLQNERSRLERIGEIDTPFGGSAPVYLGKHDSMDYLYISRHGEHGYSIAAPFVNYRANIWALKELGVERIVSWSGPAAISPDIGIGEIVVPEDIIDETRHRASTFFEGTGLGFVRQSPTFCPELSATLTAAATERRGTCRTTDVYVCTEGPRLETAAEIRKFAAYGGTLVGMTLVPEAFLAKELEMCYAPLCYTTNYAEGVRKRSFRSGVLFEGLLDEDEAKSVDDAVGAAAQLALTALVRLGESPRKCDCSRLMERYRKRGDIGQDWHTWRPSGGRTS